VHVATCERQCKRGASRGNGADGDVWSQVDAGGLVCQEDSGHGCGNRDCLRVGTSASKAGVGVRTFEKLLREVDRQIVLLDDRNLLRCLECTALAENLPTLSWNNLDGDGVGLESRKHAAIVVI